MIRQNLEAPFLVTTPKISTRERENMRLFRVLMLLLIVFNGLSIVSAQGDGKIKISTNRYIRGGQMIIRLIGLDLLNDLQNGVRLELAGEYCDARKKYLEKIEAEIRWQTSAGFMDYESKRVRFLVDDKEVSIDSTVKNSLNQRSVKWFVLGAAIPLETLQEIAAGRRVEMQIGAFKFELSEDALSKLREFTDRAVTMREEARRSA
jgi:hypothetical protein